MPAQVWLAADMTVVGLCPPLSGLRKQADKIPQQNASSAVIYNTVAGKTHKGTRYHRDF